MGADARRKIKTQTLTNYENCHVIDQKKRPVAYYTTGDENPPVLSLAGYGCGCLKCNIFKTKPFKCMKKGLQVHGLLLFIMRVSLVNVVLAFSVISLAHAGDAAAQVLDQKVSINLGEVTLRSALSHIERVADVKFLYQSKLVSSRDRVQLNVSEERLAEVLKEILEPRHIRFEAEGNQIVLTKEAMEMVVGRIGDPSGSENPAIQITGRITNEENQPLPGVSVLIKGTSQGSASDADGNYTLAVPDGNAVLIFSFIGYKTQEISYRSNRFHLPRGPDCDSCQ